MATLSQILSEQYGSNSWSITGDDYSTLVWTDAASKPSEATLLSLSSQVDATLATRNAALAKSNLLQEQLATIVRLYADAFITINTAQPNLFPQALKNRFTSILQTFTNLSV